MLRSRDRTQITCYAYPAVECWSRTSFHVQGMGITLPQLAERFLVFCGSRKNALDGIEKVLCCQVLSALTWEDDAVSFKGLSEEMSFPMWCEFIQVWWVSGRISSGGLALLSSAGDVI